MRPSFPFRRAYLEAAATLPQEDAAAFLSALVRYGLDDKEPLLSPVPALVFSYLRPQVDKDKKQYQNGLKGGRPKTQLKPNSNPTETQPKPNRNPTITQSKPNRNPVKTQIENPESLVVQCAEYVSMTNAEHEKLLSAYGAADTQRLIDILNNYKGSTGKSYKSDYRAILSWCVDRLSDDKRKAAPTGGRPTFSDLVQRRKEAAT